jgi:hypothetical protein
MLSLFGILWLRDSTLAAIVPTSLYVRRLRKKSAAPRAKAAPARWEIIRLRSTGQLLAVVEAPDEIAALQVAAERLDLRASDLPRLIVRRA